MSTSACSTSWGASQASPNSASSPSCGASTAPTRTPSRCCAPSPRHGPHILQGPGENAGIVDFDDRLAIVFKMESHNHPSALEPYQGAATGVGRHPARHLHDGRAPHRAARSAALRRPAQSAHAAHHLGRGRGNRRLRQFRRRADGRRRVLLLARLRRQSARQCDVRRHHREGQDHPRRGHRRRQPGRVSSATPPDATASTAPRSPAPS